MDFSYTPNENTKDPLKEYGRNLTELASSNKLEPVINRDDEIRSIIRILSRKTKNNPVLVGEPGVGKTAIVEGLARKIVENQVPENLKNKTVVELDMASLVAGTQFRGQFEERIKNVLKKVEESNGNIILFIDEIHMLVGAGSTSDGSMDAANIIKPMMARGQLHLIGATTLDEYREKIEKDPALERRMQKVFIEEPSIDDTITILRGIKERYETYHDVKIEDDALVAAANLSARYISDRFLPDKAIDLIDEAASNIKTEMNYIPEPLEKIQQQIAKLEIEKVALKNETNSKKVTDRIKEIDEELKKARVEEQTLKSSWEAEKRLIQKISGIKEDIETLKNKLTIYQGEGNYVEASKIMYVLLPNLQKQLKEAETKIASQKDRLVKELVDAEEVASVVSKWTKIPVAKLLEAQKNKLINLEQSLNKRVKGQPEAIKLVAEAIRRAKANINDPNRPIGSFLFLGPTGVGKTELARALAENLFDDENRIIRLDMSEYMEKYSVSRLIGSAPGYIGYEKGGQLTEKVRQNPYSIVLFDEIDKANVDILNLLLQIMDNGTLTDARGRQINFRNTIIIMTSNLGSDMSSGSKDYNELKNMLLKHLRPEFINRIDEVVKFNSLDEKTIKDIVELELNKLKNRLIKNSNVKMTYDKEVVEYIAKNSYDPAFGARPIRRYIQKNLEGTLALNLIDGKIKEGDNVPIVIDKDKIVVVTSKKDELN
ncbi:ATP-dependent Clp protease ATP-binding subunit [Metamycoplasma salivarium]|uniref:ATPase n=2 Tax=Metamycoplasma salivarium TaxID=2124 RepID=A0A448ZZG1_METSV|nr:AAA family ATPase [Metamycoplasma salivarium]CAD7361417.1 ATPase [Metamycoplasma salivarium]VEU56613.1 ATPase [Metamycoplasma salivarium]